MHRPIQTLQKQRRGLRRHSSKLLKRDLLPAKLCRSGRGKIVISNIIDEEEGERCAMDLGSVTL